MPSSAPSNPRVHVHSAKSPNRKTGLYCLTVRIFTDHPLPDEAVETLKNVIPPYLDKVRKLSKEAV